MRLIGDALAWCVRGLLSFKAVRARLHYEILRVVMYEPRIAGPPERLHMAPGAQRNNFLAVTNSGHIWIEDFVFFGKNVSLITGTHDPAGFDADRRDRFPRDGRDIVIRRGAWIATNAIVLGPCVVGEHAVVAAGSVVTKDVPPYAIVGGVPARVIRSVRPAELREGREQ